MTNLEHALQYVDKGKYVEFIAFAKLHKGEFNSLARLESAFIFGKIDNKDIKDEMRKMAYSLFAETQETPEPMTTTKTPLEHEITAARNHISTSRMTLSYGELMRMYLDNELVMHDKAKSRLLAWNITQKTAFIESLLLGLPTSPIIVSQANDGVWHILDGAEGIGAFIGFFGHCEADNAESDAMLNLYTLAAGVLLPSLAQYHIATLPRKLVLNLKRANCDVHILHEPTQKVIDAILNRNNNPAAVRA